MTSSTGWGALEKRLNSVKKPVRTFALCDDPEIRDRYQVAKREAEEADAALAALTDGADPGIRSRLPPTHAAGERYRPRTM